MDPAMNPKLIKGIAKIALSIIGAVAIGYAMKAEQKIEERIDAYYDEPTTVNEIDK